MSPDFEAQLAAVHQKYATAPIRVHTMGQFVVWRGAAQVAQKDWGRDKTIQLFQFFITSRRRKALHKAQIMDRLWEEDESTGEQNFKVALHGISKALEPDKKSHAEARFIVRQGQTYQLNAAEVWIDAEAFEQYVAIGNQCAGTAPELAKNAWQAAIALYQGSYLPERIYEDWSCDERERLQVLSLGALVNLAEMVLPDNPMESVRLAQEALLLDEAWEDAWRIQIAAYYAKGNRPMAIKTYRQCEKILLDTMGIAPLPETQKIYRQLLAE